MSEYSIIIDVNSILMLAACSILAVLMYITGHYSLKKKDTFSYKIFLIGSSSIF